MICVACSMDLPEEAFAKNKNKSRGYQYRCKECHASYMKAWRLENKNREQATARKRYQEIGCTARHLAKASKRRATLLNATPSWVAKEELYAIEELYTQAKELERLTGIKFHVDHVIPLQGKLCTGLHTVSNLQIVTAHENLRKGNR